MSRNEPVFNWRVIGSNDAEYECTTMEEALRIAGKRGIIEPIENASPVRNPVKRKVKNPMIQNLRGKGFARVVRLLDGLVEISLFDAQTKGPPTEVGSLMMIHRPSDIFEVISSLADDGYGPLLYEIAMEYAVQKGAIGMAPDRNIVSYPAEQVWEKFLHRKDVSMCHLEHCSEPQLSLHERDHLNWAMWKKKPNQINKLKKKGQWAEGSEQLYSGSWNDRRTGNPARLRKPDYEVELEDGHNVKYSTDQSRGKGAFGYIAEHDYFGFVVMMTPKKFLQLAASLTTPFKESFDYLGGQMFSKDEDRQAISPSYLNIEKNEEGVYVVRAHEGRHRMTLLSKRSPRTHFPVVIKLGTTRARNVKPSDIKQLQEGAFQEIAWELSKHGGYKYYVNWISGPLFSDEVMLQGERHDLADVHSPPIDQNAVNQTYNRFAELEARERDAEEKREREEEKHERELEELQARGRARRARLTIEQIEAEDEQVSELMDLMFGGGLHRKNPPTKLYHISHAKFNSFEQQFNRGNKATDAGFHFGTLETVRVVPQLMYHRGKINVGDTVYLYSVELDVNNPLLLKENRLGSWSINNLLKAIFESNDGEGLDFLTDADLEAYDEDIITTPSGENLKGLYWDERTQIAEFGSWLESKGFDSVIYENTYEGGGESIIVFDPARIKITGVEELLVPQFRHRNPAKRVLPKGWSMKGTQSWTPAKSKQDKWKPYKGGWRLDSIETYVITPIQGGKFMLEAYDFIVEGPREAAGFDDLDKAKKAGERWERSRAARKNPRTKNGLLSPHDAARLLQTLAQGTSDTIHEVKVRRVGQGHFVIKGTRYTTQEAASIVAREGCAQ